MADVNYLRFLYDDTASLTDNYIVEEPHIVSATTSPIVLVTGGLFYTKDLVVRMASSGVPLTLDVDYKLIGPDSYRTSLTGFETASAIELQAQHTGTLLITHRLVGGTEGMLNAFIDWLASALDEAKNSTVEFVKLKNRPYEYPPEQHTHVLTDLQRWEEVNALLLMIRDAILGNHSIGSSTEALKRADQNILNLIGELQREINTVNVRVQELAKRIENFQQFDLDGGDGGEIDFQGRHEQIDSFVVPTIDLDDPNGLTHPNSPVAPSLIYPRDYARGVARYPTLLGSLVRDGEGNTVRSELAVLWKVINDDGVVVLEKGKVYEPYVVPRLDLYEEQVELERGGKYTVEMTYTLLTEELNLLDHAPHEDILQSNFARFFVANNRLDQVMVENLNATDESSLGYDISTTRNGKIVSLAVRNNNGDYLPQIRFLTRGGWLTETVPIPVNNDEFANRIAWSTVIDPNGKWVIFGGRDEDFVRKYKLITQVDPDGFVEILVLGEAESIMAPDIAKGKNFGTGLAVSGDGSVVSIAAVANDGIIVFYSVEGTDFDHLHTLNLEDNTSKYYGGIGYRMALSTTGDILVASSWLSKTLPDGLTRGCVMVFRRIAGTWRAINEYVDSRVQVDGLWGGSLAFSSETNTVYVSERARNVEGISNRGRGYTYKLNPLTGELTPDQIFDSISPNHSVSYGDAALSADGKMLVIGECYGGGNSEGGYLHLYSPTSEGYVRRKSMTFPNANIRPRRVTLSLDGSTAAFSSALGASTDKEATNFFIIR